MRELTDKQVEQVDAINGIAYNAMAELLEEDVEWNMEWIGEISDVLCDIAIRYFGKKEMDVYPYIKE